VSGAARLEVHAPGCEPLAVDVDPTLTVGRAADGLVLVDERCSRLHCRFGVGGAGLVVEDLGSTNGTYVNGDPILRQTCLQAGDVVVVGSTRIVVLADGGPPPPATSEELDATVGRLRASVVGGTVTIAFTDIVDSTAIGAALGDRGWFALLDRHDRIVRALLGEFAGTEIKHQGDGFMLAFPSARQAVHFGAALQRELARGRGLDAAFAVRVRVGIHTGEVIHVDGDLFGRHVNIAARVAAAADDDEVLVSRLVYELASAMGDLEFGAPREVELRGFTDPFVLYPVVGPV